MTFGTGSTGVDQDYPNQALALLVAAYPSYTSGFLHRRNLGVPSQTTAQMISRAAATIDPYLSTASWGKKILLWWEGTNSLFFGASAATTISQLDSYYSARRTAGWEHLIEFGILPRSGGSTPGTFEADRQTIRTDRLSKYTIATAFSNIWANADGDLYVDLAADTDIGEAGDETNVTYYSGDRVHLADAGYTKVATHAKNAVSIYF